MLPEHFDTGHSSKLMIPQPNFDVLAKEGGSKTANAARTRYYTVKQKINNLKSGSAAGGDKGTPAKTKPATPKRKRAGAGKVDDSAHSAKKGKKSLLSAEAAQQDGGEDGNASNFANRKLIKEETLDEEIDEN